MCNEANTCGWGLCPYNGRLARLSRDANGQIDFGGLPQEGWPYGDQAQVMVDEAGQPVNLKGRATGAVIEVVVDHSDGSLAFGVNGAPPRRVPNGWPPGYNPDSEDEEEQPEPPAKLPFKFPQHAPIRPWAFLMKDNDRVSFVQKYLSA